MKKVFLFCFLTVGLFRWGVAMDGRERPRSSLRDDLLGNLKTAALFTNLTTLCGRAIGKDMEGRAHSYPYDGWFRKAFWELEDATVELREKLAFVLLLARRHECLAKVKTRIHEFLFSDQYNGAAERLYIWFFPEEGSEEAKSEKLSPDGAYFGLPGPRRCDDIDDKRYFFDKKLLKTIGPDFCDLRLEEKEKMLYLKIFLIARAQKEG